jgi:hypothetical protein
LYRIGSIGWFLKGSGSDRSSKIEDGYSLNQKFFD